MEPDDFGPRLGRGAVMSLYSAAAEPTSHAVRVVLAEKAVNVEIHFVSDHDRPEDLHWFNPAATGVIARQAALLPSERNP